MSCHDFSHPSLWIDIGHGFGVEAIRVNRPLSQNISKAIGEGYQNTLKSLNLTGNFFMHTDDLEFIFKSCPHVEELQLSYSDALSPLLDKFPTYFNHLKHVYVAGGTLFSNDRRENLKTAFPDARFEF